MTDISIDYLRLGDIEFAKRNPRSHDVDGVAGSIGRFGMAAVPVRDDRTGRLVAGHGRIKALRQMKDEGQDPPDGIDVGLDGEWLVPVETGWASKSDAEAESYLVGDNEWSMRGGWDYPQLVEVLEEATAVDPDLLTHTGITREQLAEIAAGSDLPASLDDLYAEHGDPDEKAGWPWLRFSVPPHIQDSFEAVLALVGDGEEPAHVRMGRVAALATRALGANL